ncbi:MAG: PRD domain-containing protein [Erysipelotrichaceae bacterium]
MYLVEKVLNNNAVLARRLQDNENVVLLKVGVGFGIKVGDHVAEQDDMQVYVFRKEHQMRGDMVYRINPIFFEISNNIMELLKRDFEVIDEGRMMTLADHIAFAYERIQSNRRLPNPFNQQVMVLYSMEYRYALEAKAIIERFLPIHIDEDEVGYLTLHIHAMLASRDISSSMEIARVLKMCTDKIEEMTEHRMNPASLDYLRVVTHLKWLVMRAEKKESVAIDISDVVRYKHNEAYQIALEVKKILNQELRLEIMDAEVGYLGIHIQRMMMA